MGLVNRCGTCTSYAGSRLEGRTVSTVPGSYDPANEFGY